MWRFKQQLRNNTLYVQKIGDVDDDEMFVFETAHSLGIQVPMRDIYYFATAPS